MQHFDDPNPGIILCVRQANERWRYNVMPSLIGWTHTENDLWSTGSKPQQTPKKLLPST